MPENTKHLLIVEDEAALRTVVAERLSDAGFDVAQATNGEEALQRLAEFAFDIVVTDLRLPGIDGGKVLEEAIARYPEIIGIVVTGFGTVKDAVDAIKRGAADFITKPFQFDELLHVLNAALEQRRLKSENAYLRSQLEQRYRFDEIIGRSRPMRDMFHLLETVAPTNSTILITGETGTGKELVARAIHHNSPRRVQRFVALNCSAIPETLLEAELFGHVRGAFTGAVGNRPGRFEQAHKGTLFLDEVGHDEQRAADETAARAAGARVREGGRFAAHQGGRARDCRHQQRPRRRWCRRDASARTSSTASTSFPFGCPRCATAATTSRCSSSTSSSGSAATSCPARPIDDRVAAGDAHADGVRLARQRAAARERAGARGRAERRPAADRAGRPAEPTCRRPATQADRATLSCPKKASTSSSSSRASSGS